MTVLNSKVRLLCASAVLVCGLAMPAAAQDVSAGPEIVVGELFLTYPSGGDFFAGELAKLILANPDNADLILARLPTASPFQQKAIARALASAIATMSQSADTAQVDAAQELSEEIAKLITCVSPGEGAEAPSDCPEYATESVQQFASAYLSIQSGEATAAISSGFTAPAPLGAPSAGGGALGSAGTQLGGEEQTASNSDINSLSNSNTPSSRAASGGGTTLLQISPN